MEWQDLLLEKRLGASEDGPNRQGRTEFDSDVDRIIFASSFRRLGRKTQVHPLAANDHVHTRLTHSIEVSRVGASLAQRIGERLRKEPEKYQPELPKNYTPQDLRAIVQAACLAHDLGNPPFGHAGEEAIRHWFDQNSEQFSAHLKEEYRRDLQALEGNAQGFRILTQLENHIFDGGLRLTYATLGAFQKYPWTSKRNEKKFGAYLSEREILDEVFTGLKIPKAPDGKWYRHPLAYFVEAADDICYGIIDVEDAVEIGILDYEAAEEKFLQALPDKARTSLKNSLVEGAHRVNFARMRGSLMDVVLNAAADSFLSNYSEIMEGGPHSSLFDLLPEDSPGRKLIEETKALARSSIFNDPKKVEIEVGSYATFDTLLSELCAAAVNKAEVLSQNGDDKKLQWKSDRILKLLGDHAPTADNAPPGGWTEYQCIRRVIDFISGMTDNYATYISKQLQGCGFSGGQRP